MRKLLFISFLLLLMNCNAQQTDWAYSYPISPGHHVSPKGICTFADRVAIGGTYLDLNHGMGHYACTLDTSGNLLWIDTLAVKSPGVWLESTIAYDKNGALFFAGGFLDTLLADGNEYPFQGGENLFLTKYSASGSRQWIKTYAHARMGDMFVDRFNNLYALVSFTDSLDFYGQHFVSSGNSDLLIVKINPNDSLVFYKQLHGYLWGKKIKRTAQDRIVLLGEAQDTLYFDNYHYACLHNPYHNEPFVLQLDTMGNALAYHSLVGSSIERSEDIAVNTDGKFMVGGGGSWTLGSWAHVDAFQASGSPLFQHGFFGGNGYGSSNYMNSLAMDDTIGVWCLGYEVSYYNYGQSNSYYDSQLFLRKLDFNGNLIANDTFRLSEIAAYLEKDMVFDDHHNLYLTTQIPSGDTLFFPGHTVVNATAKLGMAVAKFNVSAGGAVGLPALSSSIGEIVLHPNPSEGEFWIKYNGNAAHKKTLQVRNSLGETVETRELGPDENEAVFRNYSKGIYFIEMHSSSEKLSGKLIVH